MSTVTWHRGLETRSPFLYRQALEMHSVVGETAVASGKHLESKFCLQKTAGVGCGQLELNHMLTILCFSFTATVYRLTQPIFSFAAGDGRWRHHRCIPAADRWTLLSSSHLSDGHPQTTATPTFTGSLLLPAYLCYYCSYYYYHYHFLNLKGCVYVCVCVKISETGQKLEEFALLDLKMVELWLEKQQLWNLS